MQNKLKEKYTTSKELMSDLYELMKNEDYVFRGINNTNQLNPSICRVFGACDLSEEEIDMLYKLYRLSPDLIKNDSDYLDFLACAQHYGLPTRLIDWTKNPFVAIYFSINKKKKEDEEYRIYYTNLNNNTVIDNGYSAHDVLDPADKNCIEKYIDFLKLIKKDRAKFVSNINNRNLKLGESGVCVDSPINDGLIFYDARYSNARLIAQSGIFSIPIEINDNLAKNEIESNTYYTILEFDDTERELMIKHLDRIGCNKYKLFPEIENLCSYIVEKELDGTFKEIKRRFGKDYKYE